MIYNIEKDSDKNEVINFLVNTVITSPLQIVVRDLVERNGLMFPKSMAHRDQNYIDWVKSQPSAISRRPADDAHHIKGYGHKSGVSDFKTVPLTRDEHVYLHSIGWKEWEKAHPSQAYLALDTLEKAILDGFFFNYMP